jgi:hypothetical protein
VVVGIGTENKNNHFNSKFLRNIDIYLEKVCVCVYVCESRFIHFSTRSYITQSDCRLRGIARYSCTQVPQVSPTLNSPSPVHLATLQAYRMKSMTDSSRSFVRVLHK